MFYTGLLIQIPVLPVSLHGHTAVCNLQRGLCSNRNHDCFLSENICGILFILSVSLFITILFLTFFFVNALSNIIGDVIKNVHIIKCC